ncbi:MAG TPA: hypothetical protein DD412_07440 [Holosporales bacterium]|nr:hypothetical protein [Holosporales bacterium]
MSRTSIFALVLLNISWTIVLSDFINGPYDLLSFMKEALIQGIMLFSSPILTVFLILSHQKDR